MYRVVQTIKGMLFWGTLFLAALYFGLKLPLEDLWYEATNGNIYVKIVSIYLLISPVAWIILAFVEAVLNVRDGMRVICCIGASFLPNFWPVYKFLDWRDPEPENMIYHIVRGLVWYGFIGFCVWSVVNQVPNRIMQRIDRDVIPMTTSWYMQFVFKGHLYDMNSAATELLTESIRSCEDRIVRYLFSVGCPVVFLYSKTSWD